MINKYTGTLLVPRTLLRQEMPPLSTFGAQWGMTTC